MLNYKFPYTELGQNVEATVVLLSDELSEFGEQVVLARWKGKVDFFEAAKEATSQSNPSSSKSVHSSQVTINGDPFKIKDAYVSGSITIGPTVFRIKSFKRRRNPDGSVHHVLFEVE